MSKEIEIKLPCGSRPGRLWFNINVTINNYLIGDSYDSSDWDTFKIPLPEGVWRIVRSKSDEHKIVLKLDSHKHREKRLKRLLSE